MTAARTFEHRQIWEPTSDGYRTATRLLAEAAAERFAPITAVIGIADGGRRPAQDIGRRLGATVKMVHARHNASDAPYAQATGSVTYDIDELRTVWRRLRITSQAAGTLLVVDDICGSGATLATIATALRELAPSTTAVRTLTLCRNVAAPPGLPDLYVWDVADWVRFLWETPVTSPATALPTPTGVIAS